MNQEAFSGWVRDALGKGDDFAVTLLESILVHASLEAVSDLHFQPDAMGTAILYRRDGVLQELGRVGSDYSERLTARLKVLADLLTYQTTTPQEGRIRAERVPGATKRMRISTIPTLFGERVVLRFFSEENQYQFPDQLGFSDDLQSELSRAIRRNNGAIMICGPAGSGKTTTAYALLRQLALRGQTLRSIMTLEDPIERPIPKTAQVGVTREGEISLPAMIKYAMRQDPEVLFVGEIRDKTTAVAALEAALTGHLLLTTFHAGSAAEAIGRLSEMGIEPFVLRGCIHTVIAQRLLRRLCGCARRVTEKVTLSFGREKFETDEYYRPVGCEKCGQTGYLGRTVVAESLPLQKEQIAQNVLSRIDTVTLQRVAEKAGMRTLAQNAFDLIRSGVTSPSEVERVLGMEND